MNAIQKFFSFKKVATIFIECAIPYHGDVIRFTQKCKLYENKNGDRKSNLSLEYYPLANLRNKVLVERFLSHQCTPEIPSYQKVKDGLPSAILHDFASLYWG